MQDMYKGLTDLIQRPVNESPAIKKMGIEDDRKISLETQQMVDVVCRLKDMKAKMTPEFIAELKELDTREEYDRAMLKLNELLVKIFPYMLKPASEESAKGITKRNN